MKVYVDTGVFVDFLINRGHVATLLRSAGQRRRDLAGLQRDADACLQRSTAGHELITSCHTLFEVEDAVFRQMKTAAAGTPHNERFAIQTARPAVLQVMTTAALFGVQLVPVTPLILDDLVGNVELQRRGVRTGDSLHVVTAIREAAELVISADSDVLALDGVFTNTAGRALRCLDTDAALALL